MGDLWVARSSKGLCKVTQDLTEEELISSLRAVFAGEPRSTNQPYKELFRRFEAYFQGRPVSFSDLTLDLRGTDFEKAVWRSVAQIPYGAIASYRDVAAEAGRPRAYRAAGNAVGKNRFMIVVPCHRVIKSDGSLGGFGGRPDIKKFLLRLEGLKRF